MKNFQLDVLYKRHCNYYSILHNYQTVESLTITIITIHSRLYNIFYPGGLDRNQISQGSPVKGMAWGSSSIARSGGARATKPEKFKILVYANPGTLQAPLNRKTYHNCFGKKHFSTEKTVGFINTYMLGRTSRYSPARPWFLHSRYLSSSEYYSPSFRYINVYFILSLLPAGIIYF